MPSPDRVVRYRCTGPICLFVHAEDGLDQHEHLNALEREGCGRCGCKRLEIWDMGHAGHIIIDWRSQKSVRKKKRQAQMRKPAPTPGCKNPRCYCNDKTSPVSLCGDGRYA